MTRRDDDDSQYRRFTLCKITGEKKTEDIRCIQNIDSPHYPQYKYEKSKITNRGN